MASDNNSPEEPAERPHRTLWPLVLAALSLPFLTVLITGGWYYHHFSNVIDAELEAGTFHDSVDIYGAPVVFNEGDALTASDIEAELHLAGYRPATEGSPGSFEESHDGLIVTPHGSSPPAGSIDSRVRIVVIAGGIRRLEANGREIKTWTAGYPLIENLSPGNETRRMITFQELPPVLIDAVVSVEDKHFFHHNGLDLPRMVKAAWIDLREQRKEQGASTLTMQLVRGLWLQPGKKWKRKIAEVMMTIHLERKWSKEQIFAAYANQVFLGTQAAYSIHGFAGASQLFFGKELRKVSPPEAALLAGMVQRPSYFNPYRNPEHAKERRDVVLGLMRDARYITRAKYVEAVNTPLNVVGYTERNDPLGAPYFLDLVGNELHSAEQQENASKSVYTTIDLNLQRAAGEAIRTGMNEVDKLLAKRYGKGGPRAEAALIALDPHTGEIKAMVGGRDYAHSQLNRIFAKRPPGSVFKPFVYAAAMNTALEGGNQILTPATIVDDSPVTFDFDQQTYRPANFRKEVFGMLTLQQALAKSDNVVAVKVAEMVGFPAVVSMARRAGLNSDIKPTPAVALGAYAVTPFEIAAAYTAFANGGAWVKPKMVVSPSWHEDRHQAMDPRVAYLMTAMLEEVMRSGTAAGVRSRGFLLPAAGKTGTSHDGWFAGFTSQLLCVVWVGFDDYRELNLEGARSALPIWTDFMKKAASLGAYRNAREFSPPGGVESAKICLESGNLAGDLCTKTTTAVFIAGTTPKEACDIHTVWQNFGQPEESPVPTRSPDFAKGAPEVVTGR